MKVIKVIITSVDVEEGTSTVKLTIKGSTLTFTDEGDIEIQAGRNLVTTYQYSFQNCTPEFIEEIMTQEEEPAEPADNLIYLETYRRQQCLELSA